MTDQEAIQMMQASVEEIGMLRAQVDRLAPKADAYDLIAKIMGLLPGRAQGFSPDLVWTLKKRITELQAQPATPVEGDAPE